MSHMKELSVLSLGAGVQSSVLALLIEDGIVMPAFDRFVAIFADTGWEPSDVYDHLDWLEKQVSFPIYRISESSLKTALQNGSIDVRIAKKPFVTMPTFGYATDGSGKKIIGKRQCTSNYKIAPIERKVRKLLGVDRFSTDIEVEMIIGISTDEFHRTKPNKRVPYIYNKYPLIEMGWSRTNCLNYFNEKYPGRELVKSACLGCPYHSDAEWLRIKTKMPEEFEETCDIEDIMRMHFPNEFFHTKRIPLREVDFSKGKAPSLMGEECEGMCGV